LPYYITLQSIINLSPINPQQQRITSSDQYSRTKTNQRGKEQVNANADQELCPMQPGMREGSIPQEAVEAGKTPLSVVL